MPPTHGKQGMVGGCGEPALRRYDIRRMAKPCCLIADLGLRIEDGG